jgi:hypothetical protein
VRDGHAGFGRAQQQHRVLDGVFGKRRDGLGRSRTGGDERLRDAIGGPVELVEGKLPALAAQDDLARTQPCRRGQGGPDSAARRLLRRRRQLAGAGGPGTLLRHRDHP